MGATGKRDEHAILGAFIGCGTYWEGNSCFSPLFFPILSTVDKNLRLSCMGLHPPLSFCNIVEKKKKKKLMKWFTIRHIFVSILSTPLNIRNAQLDSI